VAFVNRVFHFSFNQFRNPNLADGGGGTAAAGSSAGGSAGRSTASTVLFLPQPLWPWQACSTTRSSQLPWSWQTLRFFTTGTT
jgi:hypothetical protein